MKLKGSLKFINENNLNDIFWYPILSDRYNRGIWE